VDSLVSRQVFELVAAVELDGPVLRRLYGDSAYDRAVTALGVLAEFTDFNDARSAIIGRGRDWYMAAHLLRTMSQRQQAKAVYWAHNAHIAHPAGRTAENGPSGSVLRAALGCDYQAIAMTFGEGAFVAQLPNDPADRLVLDSLPRNVDESVERVMSGVAKTTALAMWGCLGDGTPVPSWLARPQQMRWVGGLWLPGSNPAEANRPTQLVRDYDGLVYIPRVTADEAPANRPVIPPRRRQQ
jgi:erythromycin esterase-like protein